MTMLDRAGTMMDELEDRLNNASRQSLVVSRLNSFALFLMEALLSLRDD